MKRQLDVGLKGVGVGGLSGLAGLAGAGAGDNLLCRYEPLLATRLAGATPIHPLLSRSIQTQERRNRRNKDITEAIKGAIKAQYAQQAQQTQQRRNNGAKTR